MITCFKCLAMFADEQPRRFKGRKALKNHMISFHGGVPKEKKRHGPPRRHKNALTNAQKNAAMLAKAGVNRASKAGIKVGKLLAAKRKIAAAKQMLKKARVA